MINKRQIVTFGAIALLSATAAPQISAADAEVKANVNLPDHNSEVRTDRNGTSNDQLQNQRQDQTLNQNLVEGQAEKVRHFNKASGLMGMEVRNRDNQKLGEIKDLVLESPGKVSYAVLAVGGFLGIGEKLIAVPPSALNVGEDGEHLVLNADKAKIMAAPGFPATAWPSPNDTQFTHFWTDISATGAPAGAEQNRRSNLDVDVNRTHNGIQGNVDVNTDRNHKIYTDADKDKKVDVDVNKH